MTKRLPEPTIKQLQEDYLRLQRAISVYLDAEVNFVEASQNYDKASGLTHKALTVLTNILQGKEAKNLEF